MQTVLITGANRGIGLAFARHYAREGWRVIAACRNPDNATDLATVPGSVDVRRMDVADADSVAAAARELAGEPIDMLINNAGIYGSSGQRFGTTDFDSWAQTFRVNTMGPMLVTETFAAHLERGPTRIVVCVTSRMGSITEADGRFHQYRSSKAALNMVARCMARDLASRRFTVVALHPGWVRTGLGGSGAPLSPEQSVASMTRVIAGLSFQDSGKFYSYDGSAVPW